MTFPSFSVGETLRSADMNAVGLWLVKTVTVGAGVSTVPVNDAFSGDFTNYRIVWSNINSNTGANLLFQFSNITGSSYLTGGSFTTFGSATLTGLGPAAATTWIVGSAGTTGSFGSIDLYAPQKATTKSFVGAGTSAGSQYSFNGFCTSTTQAVSFVLSSTGGVSFTGGTVRVYGYRD
jgi:hypothetical protein